MTDLTGKTVLVTGASSGIGLEASVKLARMGADLVVVARDAAKCDATVETVKRRSGGDKVTALVCDFSSQKSVRAMAKDYLAGHDRLDILVNNAGLVSDTRKVTEDGVELTFAVNHLGYFLLTTLLLDTLKASAPARIVNVASLGHRYGRIDLEDIGYVHGGYAIFAAYARSKLANVLFTHELSGKLAGTGVTVNCLHPGTVATNIWTRAPRWAQPLLNVIKRLTMLTAEQGAETIVHLATSQDVEGQTGGYYEKNRRVTPSARARDERMATKLWALSEQMVSGSAS